MSVCRDGWAEPTTHTPTTDTPSTVHRIQQLPAPMHVRVPPQHLPPSRCADLLRRRKILERPLDHLAKPGRVVEHQQIAAGLEMEDEIATHHNHLGGPDPGDHERTRAG